jgi:gentisate 1,2-dioxygenase
MHETEILGRNVMAVSTAKKGHAAPTAPGAQRDIQALRHAYYERIAKKDMAPLWEVMKTLVPKEPATAFVPAIWRFNDFKPMVFEGGDLITAQEAERRVLVLENPGAKGKSAITQSLYAGIQLVLPGEIAPPHRHTAGAIRFILDGDGAYTQVDGEKTLMSPGDFVITPSWTAHDHGNDSSKPMMWLDVLDVPTVNFFAAAFFEDMGEEPQNTRREHGDSLERYASGVYPDGSDTSLKRSPIINYPYTRMRPILERLQKSGEVDARHGARIRYANPFNGGWVTPTMGAHLSLLPKGFKGKPYRSTDGTIFTCAEGRGRTTADGVVLEWTKGDVFVVPSWKRYSHEATDETVLFGISDRPSQEALGIWREEN